MRTIVAGSRTICDYEFIKNKLDKCPWKITTVLSGTARGVDKLGEQWARENKIPIHRYPAEWDIYGKGAGFRRNMEMAAEADALVAVWDGESSGTKHIINECIRNRLNVLILIYK